MTSYTIPTIETERLILRTPHMNDLPAMTAFFATERSHMVGGPKDELGSWESLAKRLGHWALNGFGLWHLTEKETGAFVGWAGMISAPGWEEPELGWALMAEAEGKGLAVEATLAARDHAAQYQGLNNVISYIAHANDRSRATATRLGAHFEREGNLLEKSCQIWRHPELPLHTSHVTTERTEQ